MSITIKPLEWNFISNDFFESKVLGIMYLVYFEEDGWVATFVEDCDTLNGEWGNPLKIGTIQYKSEKDAKDACQIHFNESILKVVTEQQV